MWIRRIAFVAVFAVSAPVYAQEMNAEATRDAGTNYASAIRIGIKTPTTKPTGKAASWRGTVSASDKADWYKFSPTPARGQLIFLKVEGDGGAVKASFIDRTSGATVAEGEQTNLGYGMVMAVEKAVVLKIEHIDGDPDRPYAVGIVLTSLEAAGVPSADAATKAFAEAMSRRPKVDPPPAGFSLIVPKGKG